MIALVLIFLGQEMTLFELNDYDMCNSILEVIEEDVRTTFKEYKYGMMSVDGSILIKSNYEFECRNY